jgi:hypothetical protein
VALLVISGIAAAVPAVRATYIDTGSTASCTFNGAIIPNAAGGQFVGTTTVPWGRVYSDFVYLPGGGAVDSDPASAGSLHIGDANSTSIIMNRAGNNVTFYGNLVPGTVNVGSIGTGSVYFNQMNATNFFVPGGGSLDSSATNAGSVHIGDTNSTSIIMGRAGNKTAITGNVTISGSFSPAFRSAASTVTVSTGDRFVGVSGSGSRTVNLFATSSAIAAGQEIIVQDVGNSSGTITINPNGTDNINGVNSATTIAAAYGAKTFVTDKSGNWYWR